MGKVVLVVFIAYSNQPSVTYKGKTEGTSDCFAQAMKLADAPPVDENVVKFLIGCSFEEPIEHVPL